MKIFKNIIVFALSLLIVVYGVKIYERSTGKTVNVHAIFDALWNNASTTVDIVEKNVKNSTENISLGEQNEKDKSEVKQNTSDTNEHMEQKLKTPENGMAVSGKNNQAPFHNPDILKNGENSKDTENELLEGPIINPMDAEDREITKEILASLLPDKDEVLPEPLSEPMSLEQASKISDIHQEVWDILQ